MKVKFEAIQFDGNIGEVITFSKGQIWSGNGTGTEVFINGKESVKKGDWVIKNDMGMIYVCKQDIFEMIVS
jgi:hypothetical protein